MKNILRKIIILVCRIRQKLMVSNKFEGGNRVAISTKIKNCNLGFGTYIGPNGEFYSTNIGKFCCIGSRVNTILGTHPIDNISMHPAFYSTDLQAGFTFVKKKTYSDTLPSINIGNDVWIGSDVKILGGVKIGDGAVIATGAILTKDIPSYEVWGGVPAKKIKDRFEKEKKEELLRIKWWDKDLEWIKANLL